MDDHTPTDSDVSKRKSNPFFGMVLFSTSIFVLTILAMVAVIFSDPRAPIAKFLEAHGGRLVVAEVIVTLIVGFCALALDRIQSRRGTPRSKANSEGKSPES